MLDRVVMDVMKVVFQVMLIANDVVPEALLPEFKRFRFCFAGKPFILLGEIGLERMHDLAEIAFPGWLDEDVKMFRQKDIGQHRKRMQFLDRSQS